MDFIGGNDPLLLIMYGVMTFAPLLTALLLTVYLVQIIRRRFGKRE